MSRLRNSYMMQKSHVLSPKRSENPFIMLEKCACNRPEYLIGSITVVV